MELVRNAIFLRPILQWHRPEPSRARVICAFVMIPDKLSVGVADILSEKVAVIVTTSELEIRLSESVSVSLTVGTELSIVKVMLSVPA